MMLSAPPSGTAIPATPTTTAPAAVPPAVTPPPSAVPTATAPKIPAPTPQPGANWRTAVQATALAPQTPGLWTAEAAGFRSDIWRSMNEATWQSLLQQMPTDIRTPALRDALVAALLSNAAMPGGTLRAADTNILRATAALAGIDAALWDKFANTLPMADRSVMFAARARDMAFMERGANACPANLAELDATPLWQVYCLLAANKTTEAQLHITMLRETGKAPADALALADAIAIGEAPTMPATLDIATLRLLALWPEGDLNITSDTALMARTRAFATIERQPMMMATEAEWLAQAGAIDAAALGNAYDRTAFSDAEEAATDASAAGLQGARARAFMWQQLKAATTQPEQLRLLNSLIISGGSTSLLGEPGALLAPYLTALPSSTDNAWAAPTMFALAAAQGNAAAQKAWYAAASTMAQTIPTAKQWLARMWPLAVALGLTDTNADKIHIWITLAKTLPAGEQPAAADILALLEAGGMEVPDHLWPLVGGRPAADSTTDVGALNALNAAAAEGQQGVVLLRSIAMLRDNTETAAIPVVATVIAAWRTVGLDARAGNLLLEALVQRLYPPATQ